MLGWEFPPIVSGGLGVACYGLAKALNSHGVDVLFLLPKPRKTSATIARESRTLTPLPPPPGLPLGLNGRQEARPVLPTQVKQVPAATQSEVQHAVEQAAAQRAAIEAADRPPPAAESQGTAPNPNLEYTEEGRDVTEELHSTEQVRLQRITFVPIDAWLQPYMTATEYQKMVVEEIIDQRTVSRWETRFENAGGRWIERARTSGPHGAMRQPPNHPSSPPATAEAIHALPAPTPMSPNFADSRPYIDQPAPAESVIGVANTPYAGDLFSETERYARLALAVARGEGIGAGAMGGGGGGGFDAIHSHDWMTFEAAMAVAAESGRPLILQIHSTELDRAGASANPRIMELERLGMNAADAVIAVSYKTKTQLIEKYGIDPRKIEVVYNATEAPTNNGPADRAGDEAAHAAALPHEKTVLFLGRLTRQKGPSYFLHAAKKVLSVEPDVKFIIAGKGSMESELKALATELGIRKKVVFAGFLKKETAHSVLQTADAYVMPSVSEPFGIAPLEALAHDVPVIISKQSGVAEVLRHVLKVDFWDTDDLANKILAILRYPPLAATLRQHGQHEVRQLSWDDSAQRIIELYERLTGKQVREHSVPAEQET
jgi:glycosyltransferase involved in cell wall biosynthesis